MKNKITDLSSLMETIDNMEIYKKDYDIIKKILDYGDDALFVKILDEVVSGELEWSDFNEYLTNTEYPNDLKQQLKIQKELSDYADKMIRFKNITNSELVKTDKTALFSDSDGNGKTYTDSYNRIRNELIEKLKYVDERDTLITRIFKEKLIEKLSETVDGKFINNVFFFLKTYNIPLSMEYQIIGVNNNLSEADREFQKKNNLTDAQIKHLKMVQLLIEQEQNEEG